MTICVLYHESGYKTFKDYYTKHVLINMQKDFGELVSYNRFIELRQKVAPMLLMFTTICKQSCNGISFIDSTKISVCNTKRQSSHKTFKGCAKKGMTSMGWFYGFKLHVVINNQGEIIVKFQYHTNQNLPQIKFKTPDCQHEIILFIGGGDISYLYYIMSRELLLTNIKFISEVNMKNTHKLIAISLFTLASININAGAHYLKRLALSTVIPTTAYLTAEAGYRKLNSVDSNQQTPLLGKMSGITAAIYTHNISDTRIWKSHVINNLKETRPNALRFMLSPRCRIATALFLTGLPILTHTITNQILQKAQRIHYS